MFRIPSGFEWLEPWVFLEEDNDSKPLTLKDPPHPWASCDNHRDAALAELRWEMPESHMLQGMLLEAVAVCLDNGKDYLFVTDHPKSPIAIVHLTFRKQRDASWPCTNVLESLSDWTSEMRFDHVQSLLRTIRSEQFGGVWRDAKILHEITWKGISTLDSNQQRRAAELAYKNDLPGLKQVLDTDGTLFSKRKQDYQLDVGRDFRRFVGENIQDLLSFNQRRTSQTSVSRDCAKRQHGSDI